MELLSWPRSVITDIRTAFALRDLRCRQIAVTIIKRPTAHNTAAPTRKARALQVVQFGVYVITVMPTRKKDMLTKSSPIVRP